MSRTRRSLPNVHKEMAEVFKRKSGPQIRPDSRIRERELWEKEWKSEISTDTEDENESA